ncbi:MAG: hypothetical protein ISS47_04870 [Candidatus Omnitrophica bacterium]|nr:hypothetical protein [Candidatus Omnitrophota bacterium]
MDKFKNTKKLNLFYPLLLWLGSFLAVYLAITIRFFHFDFSLMINQLLLPHFKKITIPECDFSTIWKMILADYDIALLSLMGIILLIRKKKWQLFFPVWWLGTALIILMIWRPIWDEYYPLISIPICWLAAISFSQKTNKFKKIDIFLRWITALIIILTVLMMPNKYNRMRKSISDGLNSKEECKVLKLLLKYKPNTRWMFTDRPIFAFSTNILIPPELVVISGKRDFKNGITQDYCIDKLREYKPELILLNNIIYFGPKVLSYIEGNYTNIYQGKIPDIERYYDIKKYYTNIYQGKIPKYIWVGIDNIENFSEVKLYLRKDIVER